MIEFDAILDECLRLMRSEGYSAEDCLQRYPVQAAELRPLLASAERLSRGRAVLPSPAFRAAARMRLIEHAEASQARRPAALRPAWQIAMLIGLLALVMIASTTALAQNALPGERLYGWKLGSEGVWRTVATDRVGVDLTLADRRATELTRVFRSGAAEDKARAEYHEVLERLAAEKDSENGPKIDEALQSHQNQFSQAGIHDDKLDELVKEKGKGQGQGQGQGQGNPK